MPVLNLLPDLLCSEPYVEADLEGRADLRTLFMWNIIIGLEILLIVTVMTKFAYDTWRYLRHGELPWMAAKVM